MPDDMPALATHGLRRFHQAMIDFAQAHFGNAGEERCCCDGQRHHRSPDAISGTDDQAGERDQRHHQDQEGDRTKQIDEGAQGPVQGRRFEDAALVAGDQNDRQRNAQHQGN
ncbi:hypothetical protein D3C81_1636780 [compost metagenome]